MYVFPVTEGCGWERSGYSMKKCQWIWKTYGMSEAYLKSWNAEIRSEGAARQLLALGSSSLVYSGICSSVAASWSLLDS